MNYALHYSTPTCIAYIPTWLMNVNDTNIFGDHKHLKIAIECFRTQINFTNLKIAQVTNAYN